MPAGVHSLKEDVMQHTDFKAFLKIQWRDEEEFPETCQIRIQPPNDAELSQGRTKGGVQDIITHWHPADMTGLAVKAHSL